MTRTHRTLVLILLLASALGAAPSTRPTTRRASDLTTRPAAEAKAFQERLTKLSKRAIDEIKAGKHAEAEATLADALTMAPTHTTNLYNMACVKALRGRADASLDYLERAALEGFSDFGLMSRDPDLVSLRELPRYREILGKKDEYLRKAADRALKFLQRELGEGYLYEVDEQNKLIFATNTDRVTLEALRTWLVAQAKSQWQELFEHRPDQYISVVMPTLREYRKIMPRRDVGGFYNHENRILIVQRLGQIVTHEFTHALHRADLDPINQDHPMWLTEGLGSLYESGRFDEDGALAPADNFRLATLQEAARKNRLIPLATLLTLDEEGFRKKDATLSYGQPASLLLYLHEKKQLRAFYDTYKREYEQDKTGKSALESVTGRKLPELEREWKQWMLARPGVFDRGPQSAVMGIRFGEQEDGLRIRAVAPNGPAFAAGVKAGDVIVSIDGDTVWDQFTFIPLMIKHKPGETVALKVRRGEEYVELQVKLVPRDQPKWEERR